ncbi:MAG: DNA-binding domain-containing protein [Gammaproteobacteria bacterium]|nr:DNA-binding domain-containing protein [Gammaproteobacteria bacterium]
MPIFKTIKKVAKKPKSFEENSLFQIVPPEQLLSSLHREKMLNDIRAIVDAPKDHFSILYHHLISRFAEFVQILPTSNEDKLGSLLDYGLMRGLFVVQEFKKDQDKKIDPRIMYVLFSATLLFDVGFAAGNRSVMISDKKGAYIKQWWPHKGAMTVEDGYYKIRRGGGYPPWLSRHVAVLLARQIMPEPGFSWIAKDSYALNAWIALLNNEQIGIEELRLYFDRASEMLEEFNLEHDITLSENVEITVPPETELGEEFLKWLQENIQNEKITVNKKDSYVHIVSEGIFIDTELFKLFVSENPKTLNWKTVLNQFNLLGLNTTENNAAKITKYVYANPTGKTATTMFSLKSALAAVHSKESSFKSEAHAKVTGAQAKTETIAAITKKEAQQTTAAKQETVTAKAAATVVTGEAAKTFFAKEAAKEVATKAQEATLQTQTAPLTVTDEQRIGLSGVREGIVIPYIPIVFLGAAYLPPVDTNMIYAGQASQFRDTTSNYPDIRELFSELRDSIHPSDVITFIPDRS